MSQTETIRLLIINDDANEVERLLSMLRNSGRNTRAQHVPSIEGLEKLMADQAWDLMLAVDTAKSCEPKAALRSIKKLDKDIPVIFLTEVDPDEFNMALIDGLKAGARDVVILDDDQHLLMTMSRELGNLQERRERRTADRKLKESERRCQQLLDSSRDAIAYVEDGMFLYANQSFAERFGYKSTDDITAIPVIDIVSKADQEKYKSFMKAFKLNEEGSQDLTLTGMRNGGGEFAIDIEVNHAIYENDPCVQLLVAAKEGVDSVEMEAEIRKASSLDALTGVYNRVYMSKALSNAIRDAAEKDKFSSLHIISIDLYEDIRATIGVSGRDAATADLGQFIKGIVGNDGIFGRLSDDEFALIASGTDEEQQLQRAKNLCDKISSHICQAAGKTVQLTASIGICPITEKITNPDQVLERAHIACEEVRKAGKNGTGNNARYYVAKLGDAGSDNEALIAEIIERSLTADGFKLKFQPIISLHGETTEHYESQLKMLPDANGKAISTEEMLRVLGHNEELGRKVDRWNLINSIKSLATHRNSGHTTTMFVNVSSASLRDDSLHGWLGVALKTAGLPPESLIIEFAEADATSYLTNAKSFCENLTKMGIRCCLKHFGCTLDPFKTLSHLSVEMVKIDGSFAMDIQHKNEKADTMKQLISSINQAGKQSIVPFVENATLLATLWQAGAHFIQGNYVQAASEKMEFVFNEE
jgi:diguanylate cyclase (GGDEF)-like protein/PAS domain S-box-containing protein